MDTSFHVIFPSPDYFDRKVSFTKNLRGEKGYKVNTNFEYSSDTNEKFLSVKEIAALNKKIS